METKELFCEHCNNLISEESEYCSYCGRLFIENSKCENHNDQPSEGVCIICRLAYCRECAKEVNRIFLCHDHKDYEIYEGMVRVFGSDDDLEISYAKDCLEKEGMHPMIYMRKDTTLNLGGLDYNLFRPSGDFRTHLINEIKLMVPSVEVVEAEESLKSLGLLKNGL